VDDDIDSFTLWPGWYVNVCELFENGSSGMRIYLQIFWQFSGIICQLCVRIYIDWRSYCVISINI